MTPKISTLKQNLPLELQAQLLRPEDVAPPFGLKTGLDVFDNFVLWQGLPKGEISLLEGAPGLGATSFWLQAVQKLHQEQKWAAFVTDKASLSPHNLEQRKMDLSRLLVVKKPEKKEQLFWILQEMISSTLFETIGCQISDLAISNHQMIKLKKLCRTYKVALIFIAEKSAKLQQQILALYIQFKNNFITIQKAAHRLTPFTFDGNLVYANSLPQICQQYRS